MFLCFFIVPLFLLLRLYKILKLSLKKYNQIENIHMSPYVSSHEPLYKEKI